MGRRGGSKAKPASAGKTAASAGKAAASSSSEPRLASACTVARRDACGLVLVERYKTARTEWAFPERAANAPPLGKMLRSPLPRLEASARLGGADYSKYWWWITDAALDAVGAELDEKGFCVVNGFLGDSAAAALRDEVAGVRAAGRLERSKLAGGRSGGMLTYSHSAVRGDDVGWFDGDEAELWPRRTLSSYLQKVDTFVAELGSRVALLRSIGSRSKAMCTCYPGGGARYVRHCDNSCDAGRGDRCNGRRLSAILYLNEGWAPLDGGELRVWPPYAPKGAPPLCDVRPLFDRLILFYADYRVPHEVLPAHAERFAITTWYFDRSEYDRARQSGSAADERTDAVEAEAIEAEIAKFEARFGAGARRHASKTGGTAAAV